MKTTAKQAASANDNLEQDPAPHQLTVQRRRGDAANDEAPEPFVFVACAPYVRLPLAAWVTGYTEKAIRRKIAEGVWRAGKEYRKAPDGSVLISIAGYVKWVEGRSS